MESNLCRPFQDDMHDALGGEGVTSPILIALRDYAVCVPEPDWEVEFPDGLKVQLHAQIFTSKYHTISRLDSSGEALKRRQDEALRSLQMKVETCFIAGIPKVETAGGVILRRTAGIMWLAALQRIPMKAWRVHVVRSMTHSIIEQTGEAFFTYEAGLSVELTK